MTKPIVRDPIYRRRRFDAEIIELCVRWYITYRLSYRDLVAMMAERGIVVSHTTILRWVIRYVPEFEKRWNRFARPVNTSWRVDETYIKIRGKWSYLYRAVDKHGKTVDFLLRPDRGIAAAQAFFRKALSTSLPRWPRKITLDGHLQSHMALRLLRRENPRWKYVEVRSNQYLNNIIEQDHRAIKRRCAAMVGGFKSFGSAAITLAGIELAHRIRKRQFSFRARSISELRVTQADLGPSTRITVSQRANLDFVAPTPRWRRPENHFFKHPPNAPVPTNTNSSAEYTQVAYTTNVKAVFIELPAFERHRDDYLDDDSFAQLQAH